jgi:L-asparaginase
VKISGRMAIRQSLVFVVLSVLLARGGIAADIALPVCHMIATGGTIAMKVDPVKGAPVPALSG